MNLTSFQTPQLRDSNDNVIQQGAFGKNTAFSNAQNTGWIDYVMNDLQALQNNKANSTDLSNYLSKNGNGFINGSLGVGTQNGNRVAIGWGNLDLYFSTPFIDFHFDNDSSDYTSRIIEATRGYLSVNNNPPTTDNSNKIATTFYVKSNLANYLPLSGGRLTGNAIGRNVDNGYLELLGATSYTKGAWINLFGQDSPDNNKGYFRITARNSENSISLEGQPAGILRWGSKDVSCIDSSGTNYIRYTNGLQICWGRVINNTTDGKTITFPVAFTNAPQIATTVNHNSDDVAGGKYYIMPYLCQSNNFVCRAWIWDTNNKNWINTTAGIQYSYIAIGYWK